jgi:hypothetical protein
VAFDEVRGLYAPAARPPSRGPKKPTASAASQSTGLRSAFDEPRREDQRRAGETPRGGAQDRRQQLRVAASSQPIQREMHDVHDQEGDSEHDTFTAERLGHGQRGDEHRRDRNEQRAPDRALVGIEVLVNQA